jgi:hypothetical protein
MTGRKRQLGHDSRDRKTWTEKGVAGQPGQYSRDRTVGTSRPRQVDLKSQAEQVRLDRQRGQDRLNMIARTRLLRQSLEDRKARTGQIVR